MFLLHQLARRPAAELLTTYIDIQPATGTRSGLLCLFQNAGGEFCTLHESDMVHYIRLHNMLRDSRFADHPLVQNFDPTCRIGITREWGAFEQARQALEHQHKTDPYAGVVSPYEIANRLFARLKSGVAPAAPPKPPKSDGPG